MRTYRSGAVIASAASLAALICVPTAAAQDTPTDRELLEACDTSTDSCVFHPSAPPEYYTGEAHMVGDPVYNCTKDIQRSSVMWSDTTSQSNSVGLSMTTEAGFGKIFSISYEQSFEHTWTEEHTESQTTFVETKPHEVGWVERAAQMQKVKGTYELHFPDPFEDHYVWYVDLEVDGPAPEPSSAVSQHTRPMTEEEIAACP